MLPRFKTVAEALAEVGRHHPENGFVFQDLKGAETEYSFVDLERDTARRAGLLQASGLTKGDRVGLIIIEPEDFVLDLPRRAPGGHSSPCRSTRRSRWAASTRTLTAPRCILTTAKAQASARRQSSKLQNVLWSLVDTGAHPREASWCAETLRPEQRRRRPVPTSSSPTTSPSCSTPPGSTSRPQGRDGHPRAR